MQITLLTPQPSSMLKASLLALALRLSIQEHLMCV